MNHITNIHKHEDASSSISLVKTATVALLILLVSCGGGGGDTTPPAIYSISGTVTGAASSVTVTLSGDASASTTTDPSGDYVFTNIASGSYLVTPSLTFYTFSPLSMPVDVMGANVANTDFAATPLPAIYSISGTVTGAASSVTVTLGGDASASTTTDASGNFSFTNRASGSYLVTPSLSGYIFSPPSTPIDLIGANVANTDFAAAAELYVTDYTNDAIHVYAKNASGDIAPVRSIEGPSTGLYTPSSVKLDTVNNEIFVTNQQYDSINNVGYSITVYSGDADGDATPIRTIAGAATGFGSGTDPSNPNGPSGIIVDNMNDEIIVVDTNTNSIKFFARNANGDVGPNRTITGAATGLNRPFDLALYVANNTANNEIVVSNFFNSSITTYLRLADGDIAPLRTIIGAATNLAGPLGIVVDQDEIIVANYVDEFPTTETRITTYPRLADVDIAPIRTIAGAATGLYGPLLGISLDTGNGELAVAVRGGTPSINIFDKIDDGNQPPKRTIVGPTTQLKNPWGVTVIP